MATMVVQFGLATMPLGMARSASALASGTTSGTSGSMRQAEELSMTVAPAAARRGASWPRHRGRGGAQGEVDAREVGRLGVLDHDLGVAPGQGRAGRASRGEVAHGVHGKRRSARMRAQHDAHLAGGSDDGDAHRAIVRDAGTRPRRAADVRSDLEGPAPLERPPERELVGVLEVAADGQPAGGPRDRHAERRRARGPRTWPWPRPRWSGWCRRWPR